MKVVVDDKIPYIRGVIEQIADEVVYLPGGDFTPDTIRHADALIVRTRTRCNAALLAGSRVRFIATATIGYDHIDTTYCQQAGIGWTNCPGCNAGSVAQYLRSVLLLLHREKGLDFSSSTIGIVGVGHVGSLVRDAASALGMQVLCCDPPRTDRGEAGFLPLEELAPRCQVITFHTPLIHTGKYRTFHLADESFFNRLEGSPVLINTSRGEVVSTGALLHALESGRVSDAVIDVWENEPHISPELLRRAYIATPHIAGYSAEGKVNATRMSLEALCRFFHLPERDFAILPPPLPKETVYPNDSLSLYNPHRDSDALKAAPDCFEYLRGHYPIRREKV